MARDGFDAPLSAEPPAVAHAAPWRAPVAYTALDPRQCSNDAAAGRVLILFSGVARDGDIAYYLRAQNIDVELVDTEHDVDLLDDEHYQRITQAAQAGRYFVVFAAPPCSTFSVSRLRLGKGPPQLRSQFHPDGVPGLAHEDQRAVELSNELVRRTLAIMGAAARSGAALAIENPVPRGQPDTDYYEPAYADHASLWDLDMVNAFLTQNYMIAVDFPMCAFPSSPYQKLTRLAFTHTLQPMLRRLQGLRCTHASHPAVARGYTNTGASHGELAARYPTEFSALLAQAFASELATHASRRVQRRSGAPLQPSAFPADATTISAPHAPPGPTTAQLRRIHIDTMAPYGIIKDSAFIARVQQRTRGVHIAGVSGFAEVDSIVTIAFWSRTDDAKWVYIEIPDVYYSPSSTVNLYPVQYAFDSLRHHHAFDDVCRITLPGGHIIPFVSQRGKGYHMDVLCDNHRPSKELRPANLCPSGMHTPRVVVAAAASPAPATARRVVDLVWRRLAFPSTDIWRHVHSATTDSGLVSGSPSPTYTSSDERLAVARGRMRTAPFSRHHIDDPSTAPLYKLYMDFEGPIGVDSIIYGFRHYCAVVDGYTGFAAVYPCRAQSAIVAIEALQNFLILVRVLTRATAPPTPTIVRTDQGTPFMAAAFTDFVRSLGAEHSPAVAYSPQQNAMVERLWGIIFDMARVFLAISGLPPTFHAFAVRHAGRVHAILPTADGGVSRYEKVCQRKPSIRNLRTFGCLVEAHLSRQERYVADKRREVPLGKKLVDRAMAGIYVGSASPTPGHLVYFPETGRVHACRNVLFDEARFPGLPDAAATGPAWDAVHSSPAPPPAALQPPARYTLLPAPSPAPATPDLSVDAAASPPPASTSALPDPTSAAADAPTGAPEPRVRPKRASRTGPYASALPVAAFSDPTQATRETAERNFGAMFGSETDIVPAFAFRSVVSTAVRPDDGDSTVVRPRADASDIRIPKSYAEAMRSPEREYWKSATVLELTGLMERGCWDMVLRSSMPSGSNLMRCHIVYTVKRNADGSIDKFKARLVADGNTQRHGVDYDRVFSTVVKMSTVRLMLTVAVTRGMSLSSLDVRQAFLHADLDRPLYMHVPPGLPRVDSQSRPLVACLRKSLYGLKQAGREWNKVFVAFLIEYGFVQSPADTCLFVHVSRSVLTIMLVIWVDDIICADASADARDHFAAALAKRFDVEDKAALHWVLGISVHHDRGARTLRLSQQLYIEDTLRKFAPHIDVARRYDSPMADDIQLSHDQCPKPGSSEAAEMAPYREPYMSVVGALLWLAACTRPDLTFATSVLARFVSNPARVHYAALQRVLAYLQGTSSLGLTLRPDADIPLTVYADSSWAERFSTSGGLIFVHGALVAWWSRLQRTVAHSSAEAEYIAASLAAREGCHVRALCIDFLVKLGGATPLRLDSKSAIDMAHDPVAFKKTKHIMRESFYLRDLVSRHVYAPEHVPSEQQLADLLTKALARALFVHLRDHIMPAN